MKKYLITGSRGFVSSYFIDLLEEKKQRASVLGLDIVQGEDKQFLKYVDCSHKHIDLLDKSSLEKALYDFQPDYILHLASFSSVGFSWKDPVLCFQNNTNIFLNLVELVRELNLKCRILSVGSSEEYGNVDEKNLPLKEDMPLTPVSPYAVARLSQEWLSKVFSSGYGLDIVMTRSFNHIGPGQKDIFVIASFAKQIMEIKLQGLTRGKLKTGDLSIVRDFLDVRDVVRAYDLLFEKGLSGETYNICSGRGTSLNDIIAVMSDLAGISIITETDKNLLRPTDNKIIIGSNAKINDCTGWSPSIPLEQSLGDVLNYWENVLTGR